MKPTAVPGTAASSGGGLPGPSNPVPEDTAVHFETLSFSGPTPPKRFKRILVTGLGRSGTSAFSSLLHHCGYWMGQSDEINPSLNENTRLQKLLNKRKYEEIHSTFDQWENSHGRIAWKEPKLFLSKHRDFFESFSEDWLVILVFRDPMAVTQRRLFVEGGTLEETLHHVVLNQKVLCRFLDECRNPKLVVSYEKLMQHPETAIGEIREFLVPREDTDHSDRSIWHLMQRDRQAYREFALNQKTAVETSD